MEARPEGCAFGPCRNSLDRGGSWCYLCDVIAKLPQPRHDVDRETKNPTRDGVAEPKGGENLAFKRRRRVGPHR